MWWCITALFLGAFIGLALHNCHCIRLPAGKGDGQTTRFSQPLTRMAIPDHFLRQHRPEYNRTMPNTRLALP
jgi:hypothetical protein